MANQVTVTSRKSYLSRQWESFGKIFVGIIIVIATIVLLARNENRFVKQKAALQEWESVVVETVSSPINPDLEWNLVHFHWETSSPAKDLVDNTFWIKTEWLKLERKVEMYQWVEDSTTTTKDELGWAETTTTTYKYTTDWSDTPIDSSDFYEQAWHTNPSRWEYSYQEREKSPVIVWDFTLSPVFVEKLSNYRQLTIDLESITVPAKYKNLVVVDPSLLSWENNSEENLEIDKKTSMFYVFDDYIYIGSDIDQPEVWDLRISFYHVKTGVVSLIGQQVDNELTSYTTSNWRTISLLKEWKATAATMFADAHSSNRTLTRVLRLVGLVFMYIGFSMMLQFLVTLTKVVPFISRIVGFGTSLVSFALTLVFGLATIAIAWLIVRPVVGIILLVVWVGWAILLLKSKKKAKN